jgi:hypothetical protein
MQCSKFFFYQIQLIAGTIALIIGGRYLSASQTVLLFSLASAVMDVVYISIIGFALMKMEGDTALKDIINAMRKG